MSKYKPRFLQSPFCTKRAELLRKLICWYLKRHPLNRWAFKAHTHRHVLRAESKAACTRERCVALRLQPRIRIQKSKYRYASRTSFIDDRRRLLTSFRIRIRVVAKWRMARKDRGRAIFLNKNLAQSQLYYVQKPSQRANQTGEKNLTLLCQSCRKIAHSMWYRFVK